MKSILQDKKECYRTHSVLNLDKHHIMTGTANRKKAEKWGIWVYLNHDIHMWLHQTPEGTMYSRELKREAQRKFEEIYSHAKWMMIFHRNYL